MELFLPAEPFAHHVFMLLAQGVPLSAFADAIGVNPTGLSDF